MVNSQVALLLWGIAVVFAEEKTVCTTRTCKETARRFLESMDSSVDPCVDFYGFACGNFEKHNTIPKGKISIHALAKVESAVEEQLKKLFTTKSYFNGSAIYTNLKNYYDLCMDKVKINARSVKPALKILKKGGGWPVLEKHWNEDKWDYRKTEIWLNSNMREFGLLSVFVLNDFSDPSKRIIVIDQPQTFPSRQFLIEGYKNKLVRAYQQFLVDLAVLFGADRQTAKMELKKAVQFSIELAKITTKDEDRRDFNRLNTHMSLGKLKERWRWLDWPCLLNGLMPRGMAPLRETDMVIVAEPSYLTKLGQLLKKSSNRNVANYMMGIPARRIAKYLNNDAEELVHKLNHAKVGVEKGPRWKRCLEEVQESFTIALSSLYVKKYFDEQTKKDASNIVSEIKREVMKTLLEVTWMDKQTKKRAEEKASEIIEFIAYPPELLENRRLESYYKDLRLNESHFLEARMDLLKWKGKMKWRQLHEPASRSDWRNHADTTVANAFYNFLANSINLPAAILQPPFFDKDLPKHFNLASLGMVVGHEFTHGFDDVGRLFDANGRLRKWWDKESIDKFNKQKQCIIDQYSSFNDTKHTFRKINGVNVQGEAIADNGGLKLAYRAFLSQCKHEPPSLPGLEQYNSGQMFFISFANLWCTNQRKEASEMQILTGVHPPAEFRVNGALQNFYPFSDAFSCSSGDEMNPQQKCKVW